MTKYEGIPWLPEEEYKKAVGQLWLGLNGVFEPFKCYGLDAFVPAAIANAVRLAEDFALRVRGADHPISLEPPGRKK